MATSTLAYVTPDVLRWARESRGWELDDAAEKLHLGVDKLAKAEQGDHLLTLRQAERAAELYERPLATLYLPQPPEEEPQEAQFRRLTGAPAPPWPRAMQVLARKVRDRQLAAVELYDLLEIGPPWMTAHDDMEVVGWPVPEVTRHALGITLEEQTSWRDPAGYVPLRRWVDAVEDLGVLVMQDGTLPVELMRGFAVKDPLVPVVVLNMQDDPRARVFTLLHELAHLIRIALRLTDDDDTEDWCETFAGEILVPPPALEQALHEIERHRPIDIVDAVALRFGVTPLAAAVRIAHSDHWPRDTCIEVIREIKLRPRRDRSPGGDYYWTQIGRLGPSFIRLVFGALEGQAVTYPVASGLLGVKSSNFEKLRDYLGRRHAA